MWQASKGQRFHHSGLQSKTEMFDTRLNSGLISLQHKEGCVAQLSLPNLVEEVSGYMVHGKEKKHTGN